MQANLEEIRIQEETVAETEREDMGRGVCPQTGEGNFWSSRRGNRQR